MKFTTRQQKLIQQMISKEVHNAVRSRNALNESRRLVEVGPDRGRVDQTVLNDAVSVAADQIAVDLAQEMIAKFKAEFSAELVRIMNQHGLVGVEVDRAYMEDVLSEEEVQSAEMDSATDLQSTLVAFAQNLSEFVLHMMTEPEDF